MLTIISTSSGKEVKNKECPSKWSMIEFYGQEFAKGQDGGSSVAFRYFFFWVILERCIVFFPELFHLLDIMSRL